MTNGLKLPKDQLVALRPVDVRLYLESRGWVADPQASPPRGVLLRYPALPDAEALLPLSRDIADFASRMGDVIQMVSAVERRSVWEVLNDLSTPPGDLFRLRVLARDSTLGNLPLEEGIQLLRGGRDLLEAAAYSTIHPRALHPQRTLKQTREFLKSCRLGQTERGSFVATIIAPVSPEIQHGLNFGEPDLKGAQEPFARRVTTRLMTALGRVSDAIGEGSPHRALDEVTQGVSANLCDALVMMKPPGDQSTLDIRVSWSRNRPHVPAAVPQAVSFPEETFTLIEEVGRQLRQRALAHRERFVGKLVGVQKALRPLFEEIAGKMILSTEVGEAPARVRVDLDQDGYKRACDALRDDRRVAVSGIIRQDTKTREYLLFEPSDFEILPAP
jgi:hypothetical protein